jgi:putative transposase
MKREQVRFDAAGMFAAGMSPPEAARRLRVSRKSAYAWYHAGRCGGIDALASRGPGGSACRLDDQQVARLQAELDAGPAVHGRTEDQRWTLARITILIQRLFGVLHPARDLLPAAPPGLESAGPGALRPPSATRRDRHLGEGNLA